MPGRFVSVVGAGAYGSATVRALFHFALRGGGVRRHYLNKRAFGSASVERPVFSSQMKMVIEVEVASKTGESWRFSEDEFARWKRDMGGKAAFLWEGGDDGGGRVLIDSPRTLRRMLGHGNHKGALVVQTKAPFARDRVEAWQLA